MKPLILHPVCCYSWSCLLNNFVVLFELYVILIFTIKNELQLTEVYWFMQIFEDNLFSITVIGTFFWLLFLNVYATVHSTYFQILLNLDPWRTLFIEELISNWNSKPTHSRNNIPTNKQMNHNLPKKNGPNEFKRFNSNYNKTKSYCIITVAWDKKQRIYYKTTVTLKMKK